MCLRLKFHFRLFQQDGRHRSVWLYWPTWRHVPGRKHPPPMIELSCDVQWPSAHLTWCQSHFAFCGTWCPTYNHYSSVALSLLSILYLRPFFVHQVSCYFTHSSATNHNNHLGAGNPWLFHCLQLRLPVPCCSLPCSWSSPVIVHILSCSCSHCFATVRKT